MLDCYACLPISDPESIDEVKLALHVEFISLQLNMKDRCRRRRFKAAQTKFTVTQ